MIWSLCLVSLFTNSQGSLPSIAEIKDRTRWCLGEGAHCPVIFPFGLPACCKPYVCTVIPKTCKPNLVITFSEYKDYRCMLPPAESATNLTEINSRKSNVKNTSQEYEDLENSYESNSTFTSSSESDTSNSTSDQEASEDQEGVEDNMNVNSSGEYNNTYAEVSQNNDYSDKIEVKDVVKRSVLNNSSEVVNGIDAESSLLNNSLTDSFSSFTISKTDSDINSSEEQTNKTLEVYNESSASINSTETYETDISGQVFNKSEEVNSIMEDNSNLTSKLANATSSAINKPNNSNFEMTMEDWHSSEMHYDTRPFLKKVVTIPPLRLFHSVEVIKINESIETSA